MVVMTVIFIVVNVLLLRRCYLDIYNKPVYYTSNFVAYLLFAGITFIAHALFPSEIFAWLFGITKVMRYSFLELTTVTSMFIFHGMGLLMIALASVDLGWIFEIADDYRGTDILYDENYEKIVEYNKNSNKR